jgi:hypothetical protein
MSTFEAGKTYTTRSICDHSSIIEVKVLRRTAKTIVANLGGHRGEKRLRITERNGFETVKPYGSYRMAPTVTAK